MPTPKTSAILEPMTTLEQRKKTQHDRLLATAKRAAISADPQLRAIRSAIKTLKSFDLPNVEDAQAFLDTEAEAAAREDLAQMSRPEPS